MLFCSAMWGGNTTQTEPEHITEQPKKQSEEFIERFDMGEGRFVEKRGPTQLVVGARTDSEADKVYLEWKEEVERRAKDIEDHAKEMKRDLERQKTQEKDAAEAARLAEEERKRREEEARRKGQQDEDEEARRKKEKEEEEAEAKRRRKEELERWLKEHGFTGVNDPRREGCSCGCANNSVYPLHVAADLANAHIVELLLEAGADPTMKSSGRTPAQVALKKNKAGSHDAVLRLLRTESSKPRAGGA